MKVLTLGEMSRLMVKLALFYALLASVRSFDGFVTPDMPPTTNEDPLQVTTSIFVDDISMFNDRDMEFRIDYYLRHYWTVDPFICSSYSKILARSKANSSKTQFNEVIVNNDRACVMFWCPDTFLVQGKFTTKPSRVTPLQVLRIVASDGDSNSSSAGSCQLQYEIKLATILSCRMNFKMYPVDVQVCTAELRSFSFGDELVQLSWHSQTQLWVNPLTRIHQHLLKTSIGKTTIYRLSGSYSTLTANFTFHRQISNTLIQTYSPTTLIVILSWLSFWMALDAIPARVTLCVTSLLALVTQFAAENDDLPAMSYLNAAEIWSFTCVTFVGGTILEFAIVKYLHFMREKRFEEMLKVHLFKSDLQLDEIELPPGLVYCDWATNVRRRFPAPPTYGHCGPDELLSEEREGRVTKKKFEQFKYAMRIMRTRFEGKLRGWKVLKRVALTNSSRQSVVVRLKSRMAMMREEGLTKQRDLPNIIDTYCRVLFPVAFLLFNVIYWPVVLSA